jgi:Domain of unknown function (DUF4410)
LRNLVVCTLALTFTACGAVRHRVDLEPGLSLGERQRIEVADVTNESGKLFNVPVEQMLRDALSEQLAHADLLWNDPNATSHLTLRAQILDYERGNAFKRWLLPGYGTTVLSVRGELTDATNGSLVASFQARRTVSIGGGYSIGAWHTIFKSVAKDIARDLKKSLQGKR